MSRVTIVKALPAGATATSLGNLAAMMGGAARTSPGYGGDSNSMFGPGQPPTPQPIGGDPREYSFRPGWNYPTLPGEGRMLDYKTLRQVADIDPFVRKAIEVRKDQMGRLEWDIVARDRNNAQKARALVKAQQEAISGVKRWMDNPDGRHSWSDWINLIMEDHLVLDGVALYKRRNMDPDAGPVSAKTGAPMGKLLWLEGIDATTIKPLLDTSGRTPLPPLDAYQQFLFGMPVFGFTSEELIYAIKSQSYDSAYGFSAVEQFLSLINLNLRYWSSMNAVYTDGTLPEGIVTAPEGWTPQQISGFANNWNTTLAGDPRALRKLHMAPHGLGWIAFKEHVFDKELARFLLDILALAMDLTPSELGFEPDGNKGLGGKGFAEGQERVQDRRSVGPTVKFLCGNILNPVLWNEFNLPDLEFVVVHKEQQDEEGRSKADDMDLRNGRVSLDELIERDGGEPPGIGRMFVIGPTVILGEKDLIKLTDEGAAALGMIKPVELDDKGMPVVAPPPAAIGPDGKPMTDPKTGEPLQHPTIGPDGAPLSLPMPNKPMVPPAAAPAPVKLADVNPDLMLDDLARWQLKSHRAVKRGKSASVSFASDHIPGDLAERIATRLGKATSPDEIKAAFIDDELTKQVAARWKQLLTAEQPTG